MYQCVSPLPCHLIYQCSHRYPVRTANRLEGILKLCYYEESMTDILGESINKGREATTGKCCHGNSVKYIDCLVDGVTKALLKITESKFESQISSPLMDTILQQQSPTRSRGDHMISDDIIETIIEVSITLLQ